MKPRWMAGVGLAVGLGVAAWATAPQDSPDIKSLEDAAGAIHALSLQVAALELRLDTLENQQDGTAANSSPAAAPTAGSAAAAAPAGSPVMRIEAIEAVTPDEAAKIQAQQLLDEAEQLEQKASSQDTAAKSVIIDSRSAQVNDGSRQAAVRQMNALRAEAGEARRQARKNREQAKQLTAPRQVVRGWSGKRSIEAYTERDLSAALSRMPVGTYITAKWSLVDMDDKKATVRVTDITAVSRPADFVDRPAGSPK